MPLYRRARTFVLILSLLGFLTSLGLLTFHPVPHFLLLIANMFEHLIAIGFFGGLITFAGGLILKKEYQDYSFSWWDPVFALIAAVTMSDHGYTLVTPHPLFHECCWI